MQKRYLLLVLGAALSGVAILALADIEAGLTIVGALVWAAVILVAIILLLRPPVQLRRRTSRLLGSHRHSKLRHHGKTHRVKHDPKRLIGR